MNFAERFRNTPVIGISAPDSPPESLSNTAVLIEKTGGEPLQLNNTKPGNVEEDLNAIDALVVLGNDKGDIDPALYGQEKHPRTTIEDPVRAEYERNMLEGALARGMPIFTVCAGTQRLNVLCGGTLHQHVPEVIGHNAHGQDHNYGVAHAIAIEPDGLLDKAALSYLKHKEISPVIVVNSRHHQAIDAVGQGLKAAAYSVENGKLGIVEAIETDPKGPYAKQFILGMQAHPELCKTESFDLGTAIFTQLVKAAKSYSQKRGVSTIADGAFF